MQWAKMTKGQKDARRLDRPRGPADEQPEEELANDAESTEVERPETTHTYTLSVIRGDAGPDANGRAFGAPWLFGVQLDPEVYAWMEAHAVDQPGDDLTWVLVTPDDEHPGQPLNLVAQRTITASLPEGLHQEWLEAVRDDEEDKGWEVAYTASLAQLADDPDR